MGQFRKWLRQSDKINPFFSEMAEVPRPPGGWGLMWSTMKKPPQWGWVKRGERIVPAYTPEDPKLTDPNAIHSQDPNRRQPTGQPSTTPAAVPAAVPTTGQPTNDTEYKNQGYRLIVARYDDRKGRYKVGDKIWYHPDTKATYPATSATPATPATPSAQPQQPAVSGNWICATLKGEDRKVALRKDSSGMWICQLLDDDGNLTEIEATLEEIQQDVESVKDANGKTKMVRDPREWIGGASSAAQNQSSVTQDGNGESIGTRVTPESVRLPPHKMTEYNLAIEQQFVDTTDNIMVDALAGTGKTTMLKHLSSFIKPGEKWLYLVFNKKNQVEGQSQFPKGVDVMTTHAFLGNLLKQNGKEVGGKTELPPRGQKWKKIYQVADQMIPLDWPESIHSYYNKKAREMTSPFHWKAKRLVTKIAEMAKAYALDPNDPQIAENLMALIEKCSFDMDLSSEKRDQDRDYTPDIIEMVTQLLRYTLPGGLPNHMDQQFSMYRDQDDTLWYAALNADKINWRTGYNVVLMDEVQDFNNCQLAMAKKLKEAGSRVVAVGDPNQAMYLFRGADSEAFQKLKEVIGQGESKSLPINFRSGGNLIDWVTTHTHVKDLQTAPHLAGKGSVYAEGGTHPPIGYEDFMGLILNEFQQGKRTSEPTAMICRTNGPLAHAALTFLKNNIEFQIVGKDLSQDLEDLIKKVTWQKPHEARIEYFAGTLGNYVADLENKWQNKISKQDELQEIQGYADVLYAVLQHLEGSDYREEENGPQLRTAKDLIGYLQSKLGGADPDTDEKDTPCPTCNPGASKHGKQGCPTCKGVGFVDKFTALKAKDPNSFITLTTAHKSKGLEWERTFLMKPKEYDPKGKKIRNEEQGQQELNAWYVASTRGMNTLMVSADDEP